MSEANVKKNRMGEQNGPITKNRVFPATTLIFLTFGFSLNVSPTTRLFFAIK